MSRVIEGENGRKFKLGPMVAYQGKEDCRNATCRRRWNGNKMLDEGCVDYHCPVCHLPCGMTGHRDCVPVPDEDEMREVA